MRKNKILKIFLLTIIINLTLINFNYNNVNAKEHMNFKNITIEEGLTQGTVEALFQDSKGYIWIGTNDGLQRYNGYKFKIYRVEEDNKNSLVNNYILDIKEDASGNIWVATANGLSKIHNDGYTITNYLDSKEEGNLSHANVASILITSDDKVLIGTADGLNIYDENTDSFKRIFEGDKLTEQYINSLAEDSEKNIWVATENGISKINLDTGYSKNFTYDSNNDNTISENNVYKVYYDSDGFIWAGTYNSGACKINIKTDEITRYYSEVGDDKSLGGNFVKNFLKDSKGNMWICTDGGLSKLNTDDMSFTTYKNKIHDKNSLIDNNIFSVIQDRTGLIWLGTYSGISIFNPDRKILHYKNDPFDNRSISDNMVTALYEDEEGLLWIGSKSEGVDLLNRETDRIQNLKESNSDYIIPSDCIYDIAGNGKNIFIATDRGVATIDKVSKTGKVYDESTGLSNNIVKSIYYDDLGYLWIGTPTGLSILNLSTDELIDITYIIKKYSPSDQYIG
ncbi:histidine kinase, partial [Clostridium saudiense]|nr:histidine kinase [Clostridium saudiense]